MADAIDADIRSKLALALDVDDLVEANRRQLVADGFAETCPHRPIVEVADGEQHQPSSDLEAAQRVLAPGGEVHVEADTGPVGVGGD